MPGSPLFFLYDGHGSTRLLTDMAASVALNGSAKQIFIYDAFGNPIGFNPALALTQLLYSGEQFDARTNLQHLRDRDYDPRNGTFTQRDRHPGDIAMPQTLHKQIYTHNDPVNGTDPSGTDAIFQPSSSGELFLRINDRYADLANNTGQYTVSTSLKK